jgi:signal transduction histidine kinase
MNIKTVLDSLNFVKQCRKYNLSLWQCPQFLFLILGVVVIISSVSIYLIGVRFINDPDTVAIIVMLVAMFLMVVGFSITRSFERLAEVSRLKSEFISIVSHQLRAPLSNLRWIVDLLMSGRVEGISEKQLSYLQILRENSIRMEELIADLIVVSRIESGGLFFKNEEVSLPDLVERVISRTRPLAEASNVELGMSIKDELPLVFCDPFQISQVIENLVDNAIRYTKDKGLVKIILSRQTTKIYLEVKDNGVGVSPEDQKFLFQKFFRGRNAFKQEARGSGLGLYIAKSIIERSGGKIGFTSQEGQGSTFWFTLPIKN